MDSVFDQIKQLVATADEVARRDLIDSLNNFVLSLENANDTVHRYGHMVSSCGAIHALQRLTRYTEPTNSHHQNWV